MRVIRNTMTPRQVVSRKRMAEVFGLSPEAAEGAYKAMEAKGRIKADENGRFVLTNRRQCAGTVQVTKSGTAFLIRDDGGEDVYLGDARGVLPGDKVWAEVPDERDGYYGDREPAAVLLVLKREMSEIVAKVRVLRSRKKVLIPDDVRVKAVLTLPPEDLQKLSDGDVVVVRPIASGVLGPSKRTMREWKSKLPCANSIFRRIFPRRRCAKSPHFPTGSRKRIRPAALIFATFPL
jgi:exoribonuclease R